jgi:mono/diheme cytochrome c family protein
VNRLSPLFAACLVAAVVVTGCSKSSSDAGAKPTGPITDSASTGLKAAPGAQTVAMGDPKHGAAIFSQNCSSCHGANGAGGGIGPVLKGEKSRKDYKAAIAWIKNPVAPMPKLYPAPLSESDVDDVAAYVETL